LLKGPWVKFPAEPSTGKGREGEGWEERRKGRREGKGRGGKRVEREKGGRKKWSSSGGRMPASPCMEKAW
jgi:hypothetical protein